MNSTPRPTVLLGMSGGVDSSVAAALLVRQGYDVHGVTFQVWEHEDPTTTPSKKWEERGCCKIGIAKYVAQTLRIPYEVIEAKEAFRKEVISEFLNGYSGGTTPNPCVRCNERIKIRGLVELAVSRGFDYVATGHYVRIQKHGSNISLHRAIDLKKDQSYFLYRIRPSWLPRLIFPVGGMQKKQVWEEADSMGLPADELKESQEICFVSQGDYRTFIEQESPEAKNPGAFLDTTGRYLGQHDGIAFYTPGQRRGLGVAAGKRLYVQQVQPATNTVILGPEESLYSSTCHVSDLNLFDSNLSNLPTPVEVKVRYATPSVPATLYPVNPSTVRIQFHEPQKALCPGQSAVFYRGDQVLGGGIIQVVTNDSTNIRRVVS